MEIFMYSKVRKIQQMTTISRRVSAMLPITALFLGIACDGGSPSRTPDEFAADSALAADLALANRDTLLVDSIGAYRPPVTVDSAPTAAVMPEQPVASRADFSDVVSPAPTPAPAPAVVATAPAAAPAAPVAPTASSETPSPASEPEEPAAKKSAPAARLTGTRACTSATRDNQNECLRALLPAADARMNRIYRALITEMRLQEGTKPGARDPASVQRLRVAQRAWLVQRDTECRRSGRRTEGARWARPRVRCLGRAADRRANELADSFSRLTAR